MPTLPEVIVTLLLPFEHLFDPRTWRKPQSTDGMSAAGC